MRFRISGVLSIHLFVDANGVCCNKCCVCKEEMPTQTGAEVEGRMVIDENGPLMASLDDVFSIIHLVVHSSRRCAWRFSPIGVKKVNYKVNSMASRGVELLLTPPPRTSMN